MLKERFSVIYSISGSRSEASKKAKDICIEQTVEFPEELITDSLIRNHIFGRVESLHKKDKNTYTARISYNVEVSGFELVQFLNLIFGNISIKPGIRLEGLELSPSLLKIFKGPRFGRSGLRRLLGIKKRPLLCTAVKPLGLDSKRLADLAYQFALGGIDIIKDDHGITNQCFSPFEERVRLCAKAVQKANEKTGKNSIYAASINSPADEIMERARLAKRYGAGGLLISPGLIGFDTMRRIADDDSISLPIICHPGLLGTYVISERNGISHYALFGQIARLAGADAMIFPNYGGRFSFTKEECLSIAKGAAVKMGKIKPIFPCPGGGMSLSRVGEMLSLYGRGVIFLIGGGLFTHGPNLIENCRYFNKLVSKIPR